ncbi:MAG: D-alanyl-D-alanine carboxypeptidase, partial [Phycicoccus sp.]
MRRVLLATVAVLAMVAGYLAADVLDVVPGVLTRAGAATTPAPTGTASPVLAPSPAPSASGDLLTVSDDAPIPTAAGLARAVSAASTDPALDGGLGVSVSDGITGAVIWELAAGRARVPASTAKLMAALAVAGSLDLDATMPTTVVAAPGSRDLVLVVRGDT